MEKEHCDCFKFYFCRLVIKTVLQPGLTKDDKHVVLSANRIFSTFCPRFPATFYYELWLGPLKLLRGLWLVYALSTSLNPCWFQFLRELGGITLQLIDDDVTFLLFFNLRWGLFCPALLVKKNIIKILKMKLKYEILRSTRKLMSYVYSCWEDVAPKTCCAV